VVYLAVNWWATWYPGAEPGGGGYIAQRILSAKDERHSVLATLWFNIAHYAVRPWPWILVALCSLILYPDLADKEAGFIKVVIDPEVFPVALRGLIIAAFAAAYMSTITTQLNWGASYIINDFYRRFLARDRSERHYVAASQMATFIVMVASCVVAYFFSTIEGAWKFLIAISAGTGSVFLLRWFWWRINAWSEVSAMIASFVISLVLQFYFGLNSDDPMDFAWIVLITVLCSTLFWVLVTYLTAPEKEEVLINFYRRIRPGATLWGPIARKASDVPRRGDTAWNLLDWFCGCILVYSVLFGVGKLLFRQWTAGGLFILLAAVSGTLIYKDLSRRGWKSVTE
jgi:SSS family solute:Na+ symporter